ncbi:MAG: hypothetical protein ACI9M6_001669 [Hydrogenophaga sp.]|jgi:hypothetical protein
MGPFSGLVRERLGTRGLKSTRVFILWRAFQQIGQFVRVILSHRQDLLEQVAGGRIMVTEVAHHVTVAVDGDALSHEVHLRPAQP